MTLILLLGSSKAYNRALFCLQRHDDYTSHVELAIQKLPLIGK